MKQLLYITTTLCMIEFIKQVIRDRKRVTKRKGLTLTDHFIVYRHSRNKL